MDDPLGAFLPGPRASLEGAPQGPLRGLTFAVKDIFDVAGQVTGCGNPDWARTHEPAVANAPAVQAWLDAGATLVGKTISDELAYSLNGRNFHYGTPTNSNAPGRIPGGSSSGSAAAVAGGAVDLALGSDTGGSIRTPASYCGLFGLRPSHGRIPLTGVMPLAPTFDTIGWFARDAALLRRAGAVLLGDVAGEPSPPAGLLLAEDAFALAEPAVLSALSPLVARLEAQLGRAERVTIGEPGGGLEQWMLRFRLLQACEIWAQHGDWIEREKPRFGPEIQERFDWARSVPQSAVEEAGPQRDALTERLETLLRGGRVLCLPTTPGIAPLLSAGAEELRQHRSRVLSLTAIAGLARLPQVTMPLAQVEGCPLGLSLIAAGGGDAELLAFAERFAETTVARTETWGV